MKYVVRDKNTGRFYAKPSHYSSPYYLVKDINDARIFRNKTGALMTLGHSQPSGKRTPYGGTIWRFTLRDTMEIMPINIEI